MHWSHKLVQLFFCCLTFIGCSSGPEVDLASLPKIQLSDELNQLYQTSCINCHENDGVKAPQTGNLQHWQIVFNKPFDLTLDRVISGFGGMPPAGQCFECTQAQLEKLIHFMSRPAQ